MKYATSAALRQALEQRLLEMSKKTGLPITRLRKAVVFERMLARLVQVSGDEWVLKGAVALEFRRRVQTRTTKDLDLGHARNAEAALAMLRAAAQKDGGDSFVFAVERVAQVSPDDPGALRFLVRAELAGRAFEEMRVDVAVGDPLIGKPERISGPGLLTFAGIRAPTVPALPLEQHVAEKVHAYTRTYGRAKGSSRTKDLVDLVLIGSFARLDGDLTREALEVIFRTRATHSIPPKLPAPPANWATPYRRMASEVGLEGDLQAGHELAARLVDPVMESSVQGRRWDPKAYAWVSRSTKAGRSHRRRRGHQPRCR